MLPASSGILACGNRLNVSQKQLLCNAEMCLRLIMFLEHKLGVIRTRNPPAETVPTKSEGKEKEQKHITAAL